MWFILKPSLVWHLSLLEIPNSPIPVAQPNVILISELHIPGSMGLICLKKRDVSSFEVLVDL